METSGEAGRKALPKAKPVVRKRLKERVEKLETTITYDHSITLDEEALRELGD